MHSRALQTLLLCLPICAHAQGTFSYDQQSADEANLIEGGVAIQSNQPVGQSFTPTFSSVGFIRLWLYDGAFPNGAPGTMYLNLRSDSINGTILGSTGLVALPANSTGFTDFLFGSPVSVQPGSTYYFQPVLQDSLSRGLNQANYAYSGGTLLLNGVPDPQGHDLWFREGIIVPEPSNIALALSGLACFAVLIRRRRNC
jgi:hypothetical protein